MNQMLRKSYGFTLIELSLVMVIIGLVVGGVMIGRDLIHAAQIRAQIAQIEQYNTAANTFREKYGGLPGDLASAASFGFIARGPFAGQGDSNGVLEGITANAPASNNPSYQTGGETPVFWRDLTEANMIGGTFNTATTTTVAGGISDAATIDLYFPRAKIAPGLSVYVFSDNGTNYFGLASCDGLAATGSFYSNTTALGVSDAFAIDNKIDDGYPQTGAAQARYMNGDATPYFTWPYDSYPPFTPGPSGTSATSSDPFTCYDNNGVAGAVQRYSIGANGNTPNCAMSFRFK